MVNALYAYSRIHMLGSGLVGNKLNFDVEETNFENRIKCFQEVLDYAHSVVTFVPKLIPSTGIHGLKRTF